jgi:hypothetical protein
MNPDYSYPEFSVTAYKGTAIVAQTNFKVQPTPSNARSYSGEN